MHSTAQAKGMASASLPPHAAAAARHKAGRIRLPPAKSEYRMALWMVAGLVVPGGRNLSKARLTISVRTARNRSRSKAVADNALERLASVVADMGRCCRKSCFPTQEISRFLCCFPGWSRYFVPLDLYLGKSFE